MRDSSPGLAAAFAEGARGRGRRRHRGRARLDRPAVLRLRPARHARARCSPRATTRPSTTASRCAGPAPSRSGRTPGWPRSATGRRPSWTDRCRAGRRRRAPRASGTCSPSTPAYLRTLVDLTGIRPLTVVVDAGNGMGGYTVPAVLGDAVLPALPLTIIPLYFELDGSFPNHEANPLEPKNIVDLQQAVVEPRRRPRPRLRRRRRPLLRGRRATASRSRRARSPRWWRSASWPSTRAARSSTT